MTPKKPKAEEESLEEEAFNIAKTMWDGAEKRNFFKGYNFAITKAVEEIDKRIEFLKTKWIWIAGEKTTLPRHFFKMQELKFIKSALEALKK